MPESVAPAPSPTPSPPADSALVSCAPSEGLARRTCRNLFRLRAEPPLWQTVVFGVGCAALCLGLWWFLTRGEGEQRFVTYAELPSPHETFAREQLHSLWFDRTLTLNIIATLRRLTVGFGLATVVGVPLGILAGCFSWWGAFVAPISILGRNIPVAALIPLTFALFGIGEEQKVMFIFIACVAFILSDSARAVRDIDQRYIDTAYTLGANRLQIILKVLVPLSMPSIFNSLRLLFGLAFGYIMLAELVKSPDEAGGLGSIINMAQRLGHQEHILLILIIIPLVALTIDRALFWIQKELFPHRYGGAGILNHGLRNILHAWDDFKNLFHRPRTTGGALGADAK